MIGVQLLPATSPPEVLITFNQNDVNQLDSVLNSFFGVPMDQGLSVTLNMLDGDGDIRLDQVSGGGATEIFGPDNPPAVETVSSVQVNGVTETQVTIPFLDPYTSSGALPPGTYQVSFVGGTTLDALFSQIEQGSPWGDLAAGDPSQLVSVGQFTFQGLGATLAGAANLGIIDSTTTSVFGSLDPDNFQSAVQLYQFTLAPGHFWQVGIQVGAHAVGSALQPAVTLFDAQGNVLATRNAGTGIPSNPTDPYLFAGLQPGTYYVGVSGFGNLPNLPGGYNPVTGIAGTIGLVQPGGPFPYELSLVATPHDHPTQVISFSVNRLDPIDPSPTSLTLTFSGPIDLSNLFLVDQSQHALQVVDASGQIWPVTAESYNVSTATLTLVFDEPLPAGPYALIDPSYGGLVDLAGLPVVAPGEPPGILGSWTVAPAIGPGVSGNLGVLWPWNPNTVWPTNTGSFSVNTTLAPGQMQTYNFAIIVPGLDKLQTQVASGQVEILLFGPNGTTVLDPRDASRLSDYLALLNNGLYEIRFVNVGPHTAQVSWVLGFASVDWEKIVENGVSQTSALSLALFSPAQAAADPGQSSGSAAFAQAAFTGASGSGSAPVPANLLVTLDTALLGQPVPGAQSVAPVGPAVEMGSIALADNTGGLIPGIRYTPMSESGGWGQDDPTLEALAASPGRSEDTGIRLAADRPPARLDPEASSARADLRALSESEWVARVGSMVEEWLALLPAGSSDSSKVGEQSQVVAIASTAPAAQPKARDDFRGADARKSAGRADVGLPVSVVVATAVAIRLRQALPRWWRQRGFGTIAGRRSGRPFFQGLHAPSSKNARQSTRVRKASARS